MSPQKFVHTLNNYLSQWLKSEKKETAIELSGKKKVAYTLLGDTLYFTTIF